jgi:aryl-alcohol dehydrogenase-like predicted oxidoreductase
MEQKQLGSTQITVSSMGLGCWAIGGPWWTPEGLPCGWSEVDDSQSIRAIHQALDLGITFFDTAANYGAGHSEEVLGQALQGRREKAVIATKFGHILHPENRTVHMALTPEEQDAVAAKLPGDCEASLRRLRTDYLDVYQFHDGNFPIEKAGPVRAALEELIKTGKIRSYGWSTDDPERAAVFAAGQGCQTVQFGMNVFRDNPPMRQLLAKKQLSGIIKRPLGSGILTGKYGPDSTFPEDDYRSRADFSSERMQTLFNQLDTIKELLRTGGRTLAQGAIGYLWALDARVIPIPGFKTPQQVAENAGALAFGPLPEEIMEEIRGITNPE